MAACLHVRGPPRERRFSSPSCSSRGLPSCQASPATGELPAAAHCKSCKWSIFWAVWPQPWVHVWSIACICAGSVDVAPDVAEELLQAADQYMLEPLKRLCEVAIAADLSTDNLADVYSLSENFNAPQLGRHCMLYALEHYEELVCPLRLFAALQKLSCDCQAADVCCVQEQC